MSSLAYYEQKQPETYRLLAQYGTKHAKHTITGSVDYFKNKEKDKDVLKNIRKLKWNLTGHIMRTNKEKWTKDVVKWYHGNGKRKIGGQIKIWEDDLPKGWRRSTRNREKWKKLGETYVDRQLD
ncbi:hypothetical protein EVAR_62403_1 [Eumeta japonica]|uniref:Uncharacterized protein n=1 Tax=Eumeta variegata TaxID=151549 RepID=A0A4C1Z563_EUMVA|nr:hypothetical protein EVAR_62403_1 [Eumeta japonica]